MDKLSKLMFGKFLSPDDDRDKFKDWYARNAGINGNVTQPYDRLRSSLRRVFGPEYPDLFDYTGSTVEPKEDRAQE